MDAEKLMNENPLTKNKLKEWFLDRLMASANEFEQDDSFKEFMIKSGITDDQIITIFKEGGRASLDMFDENDVVVNIIHDWKTKKFSYRINDGKQTGKYPLRKEAEKDAMSKAVSILEALITPDVEEVIEEQKKEDKS